MSNLVAPYGGKLVNLVIDEDKAEQLKRESESFPAITLTQRQQCDLEMLLVGALSPLRGFMDEQTWQSVVDKARLPDGTLWPMPFCLDVSESLADKLKPGDRLALRDVEGFMPAVLTVSSIWQPDKQHEAQQVYGTTDDAHPGVKALYESTGKVYIGGEVVGVQLPFHYDFETLRDTPAQLRAYFTRQGWSRVVGFHTSKPMHSVHREITLRAAREVNANILIHPVVGMSKPGDIHYHARVHCYQAILQQYPKNLVALSLLPMAMRMAGPREALMNAIIRQNYGCSHYIVGTEHAAPPNVRDDAPRFYASGEAQQYVTDHQQELAIEIVAAPELVYDRDAARFVEREASDARDTQVPWSNKKVLDAISHRSEIPQWISYPRVLDEIRRVCPPRNQKGLTLFFTGLSGSGKSTLAKIIHARFIEEGGRPVTLLDGDIVRHNLSSELGFSKKDRDINVKRIGFVASEITKNRGVAICAPIAPYADTRQYVRELIEQYGAFIEIHVSTPLEVCEQRDRKGLYAKARKGIIPEFTGISDPYEEPAEPEIRIDTANTTPKEATQQIYLYLIREGYL